MIFSALEIASARQLSSAGEGFPSHCASFRAAKMHAASQESSLPALVRAESGIA